MRCSSCGAPLEAGGEQCSGCEAFESVREPAALESSSSVRPYLAETVLPANTGTPEQPQTSRLIEFPGVSKASLPQWRKELSERVREVQEKRAREAALEIAEQERREPDAPADSPAPLELLPQVEVAPLNPLVSAALRRIERAHQQATQEMRLQTNAPAMAAVAYAGGSQFRNEASQGSEVIRAATSTSPQHLHKAPEEEPRTQDKVHNLVVVPPRVKKAESSATRPSRPRRMIAEDPNDPALNYLDSVPTTVLVEPVKFRHAPAVSRLLGALVDLIIVGLFCAPFAAAIEFANGNWQDLRLVAAAALIFMVVSFLYLTISTALTGRTFGMRLLSLRIVDARTGLIPTGKQSAGRALVYQATLLTFGLASLGALLDSDKRTPHDRLTRTAVIAV